MIWNSHENAEHAEAGKHEILHGIVVDYIQDRRGGDEIRRGIGFHESCDGIAD